MTEFFETLHCKIRFHEKFFFYTFFSVLWLSYCHTDLWLDALLPQGSDHSLHSGEEIIVGHTNSIGTILSQYLAYIGHISGLYWAYFEPHLLEASPQASGSSG